jgi:CII-binding regulator of phage lambda lysogenization HflD
MEQILAFILGVGAVAFVLAVVAAFKTASKVEEIEKAISEQQDWIVRNEELINRRMDQEIDRVDQIYRECISHTDSRVDRMEHKYLLDQTQSKKLLKG